MMITQYVRKGKRRPIGVVVALNDTQLGWSLCSKKDTWSREIALAIAIGRAKNGKIGRVPQSVEETWCQVLGRLVDLRERDSREPGWVPEALAEV